MRSASDRSVFRRDNALFALCVVLSLVMLGRPDWGGEVTGLIRGSVLRPFLSIQEWAESSRSARVALGQLRAERDSAVHAAQFLHSLRAENERLRALIGLGHRLKTEFIPADVLHQALPTDGRTLLLSAGAKDGVREFDVVVAPEGLLGVVQTVESGQSIAMTWAHPEFRVSAVSANGQVAGIVGPTSTGDASRTGLEFRAITYRDTLADGAVVIASGLGGVYPRGIPVGTVVGVEREQLGWERVYRLRPSAQPSVAGHVLILHGATPLRIPAAFAPVRDTTDSVPTAQPLTAAVPPPAVIDSAARARARASRLRRQADSAAAAAASGVVPPAVEPGPVQGPPPVSTPRADTGVAQ